MGRTVIACYRPKPGQDAALHALARTHVPTLRSIGLVTDRPQSPCRRRMAPSSRCSNGRRPTPFRPRTVIPPC